MDAPTRQRTLRSTIGWSFDPLSEPDQRVFAWLGVLASGFTLAAAASCGPSCVATPPAAKSTTARRYQTGWAGRLSTE